MRVYNVHAYGCDTGFFFGRSFFLLTLCFGWKRFSENESESARAHIRSGIVNKCIHTHKCTSQSEPPRNRSICVYTYTNHIWPVYGPSCCGMKLAAKRKKGLVSLHFITVEPYMSLCLRRALTFTHENPRMITRTKHCQRPNICWVFRLVRVEQHEEKHHTNTHAERAKDITRTWVNEHSASIVS